MVRSAVFPSVSSPSVSLPARVRWHRSRTPCRRTPKLRCFANLADVRSIVREILAWMLPPDRRVVRQGVPVELSSENNGCASRKLCHCLCNLIPEVLLVLRRSVFLWCIPCQNGEIPVCLPVFHPDSSKSARHRSRRVVPLHNLSSSNRCLTNGDKHTARVIAELSIAPSPRKFFVPS